MLPLAREWARVTSQQRERLAVDLEALLHRHNRSGDETLVLYSEYLEVVATRR